MGTVGYDSTTGLGGTTRTTADPHALMSADSTYTPETDEEITEFGFHAEGSTPGTLEIGVYRVSNLALVGSANVTSTGAGRFTAAGSGTLIGGVTYGIAWRFVSNTSVFRLSLSPTQTGITNTGLNGANALANPFTSVGSLTHRYGIFATTTASSSSVTKTPTTGNLSLGGLLVLTDAFNHVRIRDVLINESGQPIGAQTNLRVLVWYGGQCIGAPDVSLNAQTCEADGTVSWSLPTGTLVNGSPIFYVSQDSVSYSNYTCARMIPSYEAS